jgi:hypothetical protein
MFEIRRRLDVTLRIENRRPIQSGDVVKGDSQNAAYYKTIVSYRNILLVESSMRNADRPC